MGYSSHRVFYICFDPFWNHFVLPWCFFYIQGWYFEMWPKVQKAL